MTRKEYETKLKDLQMQIEELKKVEIKEESKLWKPENAEHYYFISAEGTILYSVWVDGEYDNDLYEIGNCFQTREQAEFEKEKRVVRTKFKRYIKEHSDKIDFENDDWYNLEVDTYNKLIFVTNHCTIITNDYIARSEEILEDAVKFIGGNEVAKKYLFDYVGE